jgi:hypothetical protein
VTHVEGSQAFVRKLTHAALPPPRYERLREINPAHHTFCQKDVAIIHR